jgi:hypothetical protein
MRSVHVSAAFALALMACHTEEATPDPAPHAANSAAISPSAPVASSATSASTTPATLGEAITITNETPLAFIVSSPTKFQGKAIATEGTVKAVCQERGCWMTLTDDSQKTAMVRMHGHSFFVPKNASGKRARVQGTIVLVRDQKECDESKGQMAEIELDATGVELL